MTDASRRTTGREVPLPLPPGAIPCRSFVWRIRSRPRFHVSRTSTRASQRLFRTCCLPPLSAYQTRTSRWLPDDEPRRCQTRGYRAGILAAIPTRASELHSHPSSIDAAHMDGDAPACLLVLSATKHSSKLLSVSLDDLHLDSGIPFCGLAALTRWRPGYIYVSGCLSTSSFFISSSSAETGPQLLAYSLLTFFSYRPL